METVFILSHVHNEDEKLIGVYRTKADAEQGLNRLRVQPGFRDTPDAFCIDEYRINEDHWTEGYATL